MSSNVHNPLELIQKTYNLETIKGETNEENCSQHRQSIVKVSIHQPSRKNSVHDIHQITKDDLNKILIDIQENISRLKILLETINSVQTIREEFFKLKNHLLERIMEFISKLAKESLKRGSIVSKSSSTHVINYHPQYLVYCIEYFRNELLKGQYLFSSLTSIDSSNLNNIIIKPISNSLIDFNSSDDQDVQQIKKDISDLEEHIHILTQRYYSQIPDFHALDETFEGRSIGLNIHRSRFVTLQQKLSRTSSVGSIENSNICTRISEKCLLICCICHPNSI